MASPLLRALRNAERVDALTMLDPVTEYAMALGAFAAVHRLPLLRDPRAAASLLALRAQRYDLAIIPAPATRWQYAAVALAVGARKTLLHRYGGLSSAIVRFGRMEEVELCGGHRYAENRRLAKVLGAADIDESYLVPEEWKSATRIPMLLGMHTGSMNFKGNEEKRWSLDRFAEIARRHIANGHAVRAFFGPNERDDAATFAARVPGVELVERALAGAGRALSECAVFLANDSGLAHLAAGLGVTTLVLFGMTDPVRCRPIGPVVVLRPSECPPCFDEGLRRFTCVRNLQYRCLAQDLDTAYVWSAVSDALAGNGGPAGAIADRGPFRLYGRLRAG